MTITAVVRRRNAGETVACSAAVARARESVVSVTRSVCQLAGSGGRGGHRRRPQTRGIRPPRGAGGPGLATKEVPEKARKRSREKVPENLVKGLR
ncbi:hypothetical protein GCM10009716_29770 [Streptomyces sodiiphilus]|uniref:Uncharacterized protein n=1 Tax=Streptomyces sodiiphilus TaxID=226217 RepID=A0ABN2PEH6_9ACTN